MPSTRATMTTSATAAKTTNARCADDHDATSQAAGRETRARAAKTLTSQRPKPVCECVRSRSPIVSSGVCGRVVSGMATPYPADCSRPASALDATLVGAADELALEGETDHGNRDRRQQGGAELERVLRARAQLSARQAGEAGDKRLVLGRPLRDDQEVRELVPRSLERQDRQGDQGRFGHREDGRPEGPEDAGTVHPGRLLDRHRYRVEELL